MTGRNHARRGAFVAPAHRLSLDLTLREEALEADGERHCAGTTIAILGDEGKRKLASCVVRPAERAPELKQAADGSALCTAALLSNVELVNADPALVSALSYAAARRARMLDRTLLLLSAEDARSAMLAQAVGAQKGASREPWLAQRVDVAAHYAATAARAAGAPVHAESRAREVEEVVKRWLAATRSWGFFAAVDAGTLTRAQYVYALSNIYQFVRHTTRLAARAIAHSPTTELRSHFVQHLTGEVNHELIIERDLANLGEDVAYVRDAMAPNGPTQEFMSIQESMIGYYQDPVLLMASPLVAEGVSAHLDASFVHALHRCIAGWGVEAPERCSKFLVSHIHTDGGGDGHWEMTVRFLSGCLREESKHQWFVRSMRSAMRGTERLYESFVSELPSFASGAREHERGDHVQG
jgi:hypothetical protein